MQKKSIAVIAAALMPFLAGCQTGVVDEAYSVTPTIEAGADIQQGRTMFAQGNYGLAEMHFRKAVEARANDADGWMGLAAAYDQLGRFDFADRAYGQLVKLAGRQPRIVSNMGYSQLLRGNKKEALRLLMEARAALPGDPTVEANIAMASR